MMSAVRKDSGSEIRLRNREHQNVRVLPNRRLHVCKCVSVDLVCKCVSVDLVSVCVSVYTCWRCRPAFSPATAQHRSAKDQTLAPSGGGPNYSSAQHASGSSYTALHWSLTERKTRGERETDRQTDRQRQSKKQNDRDREKRECGEKRI